MSKTYNIYRIVKLYLTIFFFAWYFNVIKISIQTAEQSFIWRCHELPNYITLNLLDMAVRVPFGAVSSLKTCRSLLQYYSQPFFWNFCIYTQRSQDTGVRFKTQGLFYQPTLHSIPRFCM